MRLAGRTLGLGALIAYAAYSLILHAVHFNMLRERTFDDFGRFYYSSRSAAEGGSLYEPTIATYLQLSEVTGVGRHFWNMNPPHFQALLIPLTWLRLEDAFAVWLALNLLGAAVSIWWIARELQIRWPAYTVACAVCVAVSMAPTVTWLRTGQLSGLAMLATTAVWRFARQGRWHTAGACCGALIACKPFFAPLALLWLPRERWSALGTLVAAGAACVLAGVAIYGPHAYVEWAAVVREAQSWTWAIHNGSIYGPLAKAANAHEPRGGLPDVSNVNTIGHVLALIAVVAGAWVAWRHRRDTDRAVLVLLLTSLLASPLGWIYYGWCLAGPLLACRQLRSVRVALWVTSPAWLVHYIWIMPTTPWQALTISSAYTWAFLGTWIGAIWPQAAPPSGADA